MSAKVDVLKVVIEKFEGKFCKSGGNLENMITMGEISPTP